MLPEVRNFVLILDRFEVAKDSVIVEIDVYNQGIESMQYDPHQDVQFQSHDYRNREENSVPNTFVE
jgi:hypothetical protein